MAVIDGRDVFMEPVQQSPRLAPLNDLFRRVQKKWIEIRTALALAREQWINRERRRAIIHRRARWLRFLMWLRVPVSCEPGPVFVQHNGHNLLDRPNLGGDGLIAWAVWASNEKAVQLLLHYPSQRVHLAIAINAAIMTRQVNLIRLLLDAMSAREEKCPAWIGQRVGRQGNLDVLRVFVEKGYPLEGRYLGKFSPLYFALDRQDMDLVRFLVDSGCTVQTEDEAHAMMVWAVNQFPELTGNATEKERGPFASPILNHRFFKGQPWAEFQSGWVNLNILLGRVLGAASLQRQGVASFNTLLMEAVKKGDLNGVEEALRRQDDSDLEKPCPDNIVRFEMLKYGRDLINRQDDTGMTALHMAVQNGQYDIARVLLAAGADGTAANHQGQTPLHTACNSKNLDMVILLLQYCLGLNPKDKTGQTPLFAAVIGEWGDGVDFLLNAGADPSISDNKNMLCLQYVQGTELAGWIERLIIACARWSSEGYGMATTYSLYHSYFGIMDAIYRPGNANEMQGVYGETPLHFTVMAGNVKWTRRLLEDGVGPDIFNSSGRTPLCYCLLEDDLELFHTLLEFGADVNNVSEAGRTLLHEAAYYPGSHRIVEDAIRQNARVNATDNRGTTPLLQALENDNLQLAKRLIQAGADVTLTNEFGRSPLDYSDRPDVRELLEPGIHPGSR